MTHPRGNAKRLGAPRRRAAAWDASHAAAALRGSGSRMIGRRAQAQATLVAAFFSGWRISASSRIV